MRNPYELAERLKKLPPYLFAEIDRKKRDVRARGVGPGWREKLKAQDE